MGQVNAYDVELRVTDRGTDAGTIVTRREHAYSVMDALMQAAVNQAADSAGCEIAHVRIGPACEAVEAATRDLAEAVNRAMSRISEAAPCSR